MNGHDFGHEFVSESMSEADSDTDTRFFGTSDTDSGMGRVMTSDRGSDTHMSENLGQGLGHTSDACSLISVLELEIPGTDVIIYSKVRQYCERVFMH